MALRPHLGTHLYSLRLSALSSHSLGEHVQKAGITGIGFPSSYCKADVFVLARVLWDGHEEAL